MDHPIVDWPIVDQPIVDSFGSILLQILPYPTIQQPGPCYRILCHFLVDEVVDWPI